MICSAISGMRLAVVAKLERMRHLAHKLEDKELHNFKRRIEPIQRHGVRQWQRGRKCVRRRLL